MERTAVSQPGSWRRVFRAALPATAPVFTGYLFLGLAYGILMQTKGYGPLWSGLMSAIAFGGSMQYAAVALLTSMFDPVSAFLLSLTVNARHLFYGISMLDAYRGAGRLKPFLVFWLTDETFSVNCAAQIPQGMPPARFYFATSLLDYLYWVGATVAGGFLGAVLPFDTTGIDFVLTALFVVILLGQLEQRQNRLSALVGVGCSLACLLVLGPDRFILPAMAVILVALLALQGRPRADGSDKKKEEDAACT